MQRGADICIRIEIIKCFYNINAEIIPLKFGGAQFLLCGVKYVYNGGNCVGYNDKIHQLFKGRNIKKQGVKVYSHQKDKPKIIRENEKFAKRNFCVKSHLNGVVIK
nr:MAG TPA: hypothetical protein [Caudoviricetes sp.]